MSAPFGPAQPAADAHGWRVARTMPAARSGVHRAMRNILRIAPKASAVDATGAAERARRGLRAPIATGLSRHESAHVEHA